VGGQVGTAYYRADAPVAIAVELRAPAKFGISGTLTVAAPAAGNRPDRELFTAEVKLPRGGRRIVRALANPLPDDAMTVVAVIHDGSTEIARSSSNLLPVPRGSDWVLLADSRPEARAACPARRPARASRDWVPPWIVSTVHLEYLIPGWASLAGADALVLGADQEHWNAEWARAIPAFAAAGGIVVVNGGDAAPAIQRDLAAPLRVQTGERFVAQMGPLAAQLGYRDGSGPIACRAFGLPGGRTLARTPQGLPLVGHLPWGAGGIVWSGCDIASAPARAAGLGSTLVGWGLEHRPDGVLGRGQLLPALRLDPPYERAGDPATIQGVFTPPWLARADDPARRVALVNTALQTMAVPVPAISGVALTAGGYLVLALVMLGLGRRFRRLGLAWALLAGTGVAAFAGIAVYAEAVFGSAPAASSLTVVSGRIGGDVAAGQTLLAVYSPRALDTAVRLGSEFEGVFLPPGTPSRSTVPRPAASGRPAAQLRIAARAPARLAALRRVSLAGGLRLTGGGERPWELVNDTGLPVRWARVLHEGTVALVDLLPPGRRVTPQWAPLDRRRTLRQLVPQAIDRQHQQAITGVIVRALRTALETGTAVIVAELDAPPPSVQLGERAPMPAPGKVWLVLHGDPGRHDTANTEWAARLMRLAPSTELDGVDGMWASLLPGTKEIPLDQLAWQFRDGYSGWGSYGSPSSVPYETLAGSKDPTGIELALHPPAGAAGAIPLRIRGGWVVVVRRERGWQQAREELQVRALEVYDPAVRVFRQVATGPDWRMDPARYRRRDGRVLLRVIAASPSLGTTGPDRRGRVYTSNPRLELRVLTADAADEEEGK
jgi:hypothetical protein